jgi:CheY-like chemotaxis protein
VPHVPNHCAQLQFGSRPHRPRHSHTTDLAAPTSEWTPRTNEADHTEVKQTGTPLVMCDLLVQAGFQVAEASNGFSAIRLAQRERFALVLLDLVLPDRSGVSVLAELRAAHATAHVPVIVFCGQPHALRDAVTQADAVIAQPFAIDKLLAAVSRSRARAMYRCLPMRLMTSATELSTRPGAVEAGASRGACAVPTAVGDVEPLRPSARESPGSGDGCSPGNARPLVQAKRGYGP